MLLDVLRERQLMYMKIFCLATSPCNKFIAAATNSGKVAVFSLDNEDLTKQDTQLCELSVMANRAYSLASTSHHLICGDSRGIIRAWTWENVSSKEPLTKTSYFMNIADYSRNSSTNFDVNSLAVVPGSSANFLYAGCGDSVIYGFDLSCGKLVRTFDGHKDFIHQIAFNREKNQLFSCAEDGLIKIWDLRSAQQIANISPSLRKKSVNSGGWIGCIAVDESGDFLAFGGGVQMGIYNVPTASFATVMEPSALEAHSIVYCNDKLLVGGLSPAFYVYSVDGKLENEIPLPDTKSVFAISRSLGNSIVAVAGGGSKIELIRHFAYRSASLKIS